MVLVVVGMSDEGYDGGLKVALEGKVFEQDKVFFDGLMPALDLVLRLGAFGRITKATNLMTSKVLGKRI